MKKKLQKGIFVDKSYAEISKVKNKSFGILFLRAVNNKNAEQVGNAMHRLWNMYELLQKGVQSDLPSCIVPSGELCVLVGYGPSVFELDGVKKKIPRDLKGRQFLPLSKGTPILQGCGIKYSHDAQDNVGMSDHIVIQFISDTQLAAYRAIVETSNHLTRTSDNDILQFSRFYTGFQRDDGRSWLGFHDEVSIMKDAIERTGAIAIDAAYNRLKFEDLWTEGGTYMAFLRISIDLDSWRKLEPRQQELIVGRSKLTGCPIIAVDKKGNPLMDEACNKFREIHTYDNKFHEHPDFFKPPSVVGKNKTMVDVKASARILSQSHIGRTRHIDNIDSREPTSRRIFRQGFEFIEQTNLGKPFKVGQNFVSFQNDPSRLFFILTDPHWMGNSNFGGATNDYAIDNLLSADASGVFYVPPLQKPFPGVDIFL